MPDKTCSSPMDLQHLGERTYFCSGMTGSAWDVMSWPPVQEKKYCDKFWSKNVVSISFILINITFCNSSLLFPTLGFLYSWRKHSCNKCSLLFQRSVPRDRWHVLDASLYVCVCVWAGGSEPLVFWKMLVFTSNLKIISSFQLTIWVVWGVQLSTCIMVCTCTPLYYWERSGASVAEKKKWTHISEWLYHGSTHRYKKWWLNI